jgi:hypothetical protein
MTTPHRADKRSSAGKMSLSPTSCKLFLGRRDKPRDLRARRSVRRQDCLELTAYRARVVVETGTGEADQGLREQDYRP